jgi:hypothetical protein
MLDRDNRAIAEREQAWYDKQPKPEQEESKAFPVAALNIPDIPMW